MAYNLLDIEFCDSMILYIYIYVVYIHLMFAHLLALVYHFFLQGLQVQ